jgi:hypothetical protein
MAITVKNQFTSFSPAFNMLEVCVDSTNKAQPNFQYIIDVYIEGVSDYKRFLVDKEPSQGYGRKDIGRYVESYLTPTLAEYDNNGAFTLGLNPDGSQSIRKVVIKYGEKYGATPAIYADLTVSSDLYVFGGVFDYNTWLDFNPNAYICNITNGTSGQFLTDQKTSKVSINNLGFHHILTDTPTDIDYLVVKTYDSSGTIIQTVTKQIAVSQILTTSRNLIVTTAPESLNLITGAFVTGAQPIITSSVASYTVQLTDSSSNVASEILYFEIEEPCRYEQVRLLFLNKYYSFDGFNFNLRNQSKYTNNKQGYQKENYPIYSSGIVRRHQDQSKVLSYIESQQTITVRSNYLTTEEMEILRQLVESPDIYMEFTDRNGDRNWKAISRVTNTEWTELTEDSDKLFILELTIELSHNEKRQRR